jgi:hypothetical protein
VREDRHPSPERLGETHILRREVVGLERRDHHHAAALATPFQRHAELRTDAERLLDALELRGVAVERPGHERLAGLVDMHHAPAVRKLQYVQPQLALQHGQTLRAGREGHQRVALRVVQEGIDLVRGGSFGDQIRDVRQGRAQIPRRNAQQGFEEVELALGERGRHIRELEFGQA